ncbi:YceI family protein [Tessaracoccus caeni]|uniref:YceI family protein n=1 Tax=Tessaracoccus caeni TaxID=3031239 RepID=UPI0023DA7F0E|nr:YceI family protein [Tessaracoccus caeni]MDF1489241.1 YceI family protein [Tessaracoccus caeni]
MSLSDLSGTFVVDPTHSTVSFVTRHAMVTKVRGSFTQFSGQATVDKDDRSAFALNVEIDVASVDTRNADRDAHLRSADFFDADTFPTMTFVGTGYQIKGDVVEITGDLTIRDVTRSLTIPFEFGGTAKDPFGNTRVGLEGSVQVQRSDFGLTWNAALETGGFLVSDKVTLEFEISAIQQA